MIFAQDSLITERYQNAFADIKEAFEEKMDINFKKVNFLVENTYLENGLDYEKFNSSVQMLTKIARAWMISNPIKDYPFRDSNDFHKNFAIYTILKDSVKFIDGSGDEYVHLPFTYDFNDMFGNKEWSNMFISKLLVSKKGNCHSLPYLYKILADELGANCWLGLAPNHIYIKNRCKKTGWYNTELTSGTFPIDAWVTASGYIPLQAIQNGIYMDTLSNQQAIALCVLDLAKGYQFKTQNFYDGFILKCCDFVLQYHPVNVQAMLLKAETLKRVYEKQQNEQHSDTSATYREMESLYVKLFDLGYREMPEKMYIDWLQSVSNEVSKYSNEKIKPVVPPKSTKKL
jgi:hypothetical protein